MKENRIKRKGRTRQITLTVFALVFLVTIVTVLALTYSTLRETWLEQCIVTDLDAQVAVSGGNMIKPDVILSELGIRRGSNLAMIDYRKKREELLAKIPNLRSLAFTRHLPDRLSISLEERRPIVKLGLRGDKRVTGRVADADGMVFYCQRGTEMLPTIREEKKPGTKPGERLSKRAMAALVFLDTSRDPEFSELGVLEVDISKPDYLLATLGDYSRVKLAWTGMDDGPTTAGRERLERQLKLLVTAIRTRVSLGTIIWNATDESGIIYADNQGIPL